MADDVRMEIYRTLRASQDKYTYFLLAGAGAAIGFALTQTQTAPLKYSQLPLAVAILLWGLSFIFGCLNLAYVNSTLYANAEMLKIEGGQHPGVGIHPDYIRAASEGIRSAIDTNSNRANRYSHLQFHCFYAGAVFYIAWHVVEMYLRTPS